MELSGQIKTKCPPDFLVAVMHDPAALAKLLPAGSRIDRNADGSFAFSVSKGIGPIKLTLPGKMHLTAKGAGHDHVLSIKAAHLIGGKVDMTLDLAITHDGEMTKLKYSGDLTASGLAGRVLQEHHSRANASLKSALIRLRIYAERQMGDAGVQV